MNERPIAIALSAAALLAGCASEPPPPVTPAEPPPKPWEAQALAGPYAAVADFCKTLPPGACEERDDVILAIGEVKKPQAAKDGTPVQVVTVASNDGKTQRAHLLIKRGTELFALPPAQAYDPKDGQRHLVAVRSFSGESSGLFVLTHHAETSSGSGDSTRQEMTARQAHCRIAKDAPVACALFDTERSVATGQNLTTVTDQTAEVLVLPGGEGRVRVTAHPQSGAEALKGLAAPGEYRITFP
jgi:hypothetical protein